MRTLPGVLDELEHKMQAVESYEASYTITEGSKVLFTGRFTSKGVHRFRWEDHDPSTGTLVGLNVSDGQREWMYMPVQNLVFRSEQSHAGSSAKPLSPVMARFASGEGMEWKGESVYDGHQCYRIAVKATRGRSGVQTPAAELWFDRETGLVTRVLYAENATDRAQEITFKDFKINAPIDDGEFTFTPPLNAQSVDWLPGPGQGEGVVPLKVRIHGRKNEEAKGVEAASSRTGYRRDTLTDGAYTETVE